MKKKILSIGGCILAIAAIFGVLYLKGPTTQNTLGAITSPDITDNHISVNGVSTWTLRQNMIAATTTPCSIPNPAGAATSTDSSGNPIPPTGLGTSTLVSFSVNITTGTTSSSVYDISTSTTPYATSTQSLAYNVSIPANSQYSEFYSVQGKGDATSSDTHLIASLASASNIVGPAQQVTMKLGSTSPYTYGGQCIAVFKSLTAF